MKLVHIANLSKCMYVYVQVEYLIKCECVCVKYIHSLFIQEFFKFFFTIHIIPVLDIQHEGSILGYSFFLSSITALYVILLAVIPSNMERYDNGQNIYIYIYILYIYAYIYILCIYAYIYIYYIYAYIYAYNKVK